MAAPCDRIVCFRTTITGSIGVRMSFMNFADLAKKYGVKIGAINPNVFQDQAYKLGSFCSPDAKARKAAYDHTIDSVEIGKAVRDGKGSSKRLCKGCGHLKHDHDANHCKICGSPLPEKQA